MALLTQFGRCSTSAILTYPNEFTSPIFYSIAQNGVILGVIRPTVKRYVSHKRKPLELRFVQNQKKIFYLFQANTFIKKKSNKMQQCIKILFFHIYMKLNMFRATYRPSTGA
jgi:predicted transcriptional regulator